MQRKGLVNEFLSGRKPNQGCLGWDDNALEGGKVSYKEFIWDGMEYVLQYYMSLYEREA